MGRSSGRNSTAVSIVFALLFACFHCFSVSVSADPGVRRGEHPFITACRTGDTDTVQTFIAQQGFEINALLAGGRNWSGDSYWRKTGLYAAVEGDQPYIIEQLLGADADVNKRVCNCSPIRAAVQANRIACAIILIEHGAEFNVDDGHPPLYAASHGGHHQMVELLLGYGANPRFKDAMCGIFWKETPLFAARVMRILSPMRWKDYTKTIELLRACSQCQPVNERKPLLSHSTPPQLGFSSVIPLPTAPFGSTSSGK